MAEVENLRGWEVIRLKREGFQGRGWRGEHAFEKSMVFPAVPTRLVNSILRVWINVRVKACWRYCGNVSNLKWILSLFQRIIKGLGGNLEG